MDRRRFLRTAAGTGAALSAGPANLLQNLYAFQAAANLSHVEARYYKKLPDREIECQLCPRKCRLGDKERGSCGVRENDGGTYYTLVYGKACARNIDPVEKKPFFHVLPGTPALSIASAGCNLSCRFCQNWEISQSRPEQVTHVDFPPHEVAAAAESARCPSIAFTYSEPTVFYEYMVDTAIEARKRGVRSLVVSGGYINPEPLEALTAVVDAVKIDLKAFTPEFYKAYVRGDLAPVLEAIKLVAKRKTWLEIVYLVIPTLNDDPDDVRRMVRWILREIGPGVPLHFTRFTPMYLLKNLPPTPVSTLRALRRIALEEGLAFVYTGNIPGDEGENTWCPSCKTLLIARNGFAVEKNTIKGGACPSCRAPVPGIWA